MSDCLSITLALKFEALPCFLVPPPIFPATSTKPFPTYFDLYILHYLKKNGWWIIPKCISQEAYTHVSTRFQELRPQRLDS